MGTPVPFASVFFLITRDAGSRRLWADQLATAVAHH